MRAQLGRVSPSARRAAMERLGRGSQQQPVSASSDGRIEADQVPRLRLKWAFGFPGATAANAQPTIVGGLLFVGGGDRKVYALDAKSGCTRWAFKTEALVRTAISFAPISGTDQFAVFFGDVRANAYAVNATTGALVWKTKVEDHPAARITGAPTLYSGVAVCAGFLDRGSDRIPPRLPMLHLSRQRRRAGCCDRQADLEGLHHSRGAASDKAQCHRDPALWSVRRGGVVRADHRCPAPGALCRDRDNYSNPPAETSDAILAFDLATGRMLWHRQATANDSLHHRLVSVPTDQLSGRASVRTTTLANRRSW